MAGKHRRKNLHKPISARELTARHNYTTPRISRHLPPPTARLASIAL